MAIYVKRQSSSAGLDMNAKEANSMVTANSEGATVDLCIEGENIKQVKQFLYLVSTIIEDGRSKSEVEIRTVIAKPKVSELNKLMTIRKISLALRDRMLQCYVFSVFINGAETLTFGQEICNKVNYFEIWCLRRMGKASWKDRKTNEEVCKLLKTAPILLNKIKTTILWPH